MFQTIKYSAKIDMFKAIKYHVICKIEMFQAMKYVVFEIDISSHWIFCGLLISLFYIIIKCAFS